MGLAASSPTWRPLERAGLSSATRLATKLGLGGCVMTHGGTAFCSAPFSVWCHDILQVGILTSKTCSNKQAAVKGAGLSHAGGAPASGRGQRLRKALRLFPDFAGVALPRAAQHTRCRWNSTSSGSNSAGGVFLLDIGGPSPGGLSPYRVGIVRASSMRACQSSGLISSARRKLALA